MAAFIDPDIRLLVSPLPLHKRDIERSVAFDITRREKEERERGRRRRKKKKQQRFSIARTFENREPLILGGWSRAKERVPDLFPIVASGGPLRLLLAQLPSPPLLAPLLLALGFIDPLYIYLLCRGPLCDGSKGSRRCTCRPLPPSPLTTPAIFDQYYKNQPTDFLRKILPPRSPEYFIAVHPSPPFSFSPVSTGKGEDKKAAEGNRSRERHAIRFCFVARSSSSPPSNFERREIRCGLYMRSFSLLLSGVQARYYSFSGSQV